MAIWYDSKQNTIGEKVSQRLIVFMIKEQSVHDWNYELEFAYISVHLFITISLNFIRSFIQLHLPDIAILPSLN